MLLCYYVFRQGGFHLYLILLKILHYFCQYFDLECSAVNPQDIYDRNKREKHHKEKRNRGDAMER